VHSKALAADGSAHNATEECFRADVHYAQLLTFTEERFRIDLPRIWI
jgi:hypothetical protein